jgi:hypothetical protein
MMNNPEYVQDGKLTQKGLAAMRKEMPHTDLAGFELDPDINKLGNLFTVNSVVNYVESKLAAA